MNKSTNTNNLNPETFDWKLVQIEMKSKLGLEIYESWLKKIIFVDLILLFDGYTIFKFVPGVYKFFLMDLYQKLFLNNHYLNTCNIFLDYAFLLINSFKEILA